MYRSARKVRDLYHLYPYEYRASTDSNLPHEIKVGEIIAHRFWYIVNGRLRSITRGYYWAPGPQPKINDELSPTLRGNGYYAYKSSTRCLLAARVRTSSPVVVGTVALFDEVIEHQFGYRAQSAKIISLDDGTYDNLDKLREKYGV